MFKAKGRRQKANFSGVSFFKKGTPFKFAFCLLPFAFISPCRAEVDLSHPQQAVHAFNQGVERFNAKDCNSAVEFFNDAISRDPDFAEAYYARAACRYSKQGVDGALMDLSDAIRLKPSLLDARALRGVIYYEGDHWDSALEDFNGVLVKSPQDPQSLLGRGVIRLRREEYPAAEADFRAFIKAHPDHPYAPKLRQILASLHGAAPDERSAQGEPLRAPSATRATSRRSTAGLQAMADALLRRKDDLSDHYTRQVLRGERGEAVGDISTHARPTQTKSAHSDIDIVEPH